MNKYLAVLSVTTLVWLFAFPLSILGQEPDQETVKYLEGVRKKHGLVGLSCCVIKNGKIVALGATGYRKAGAEAKLTVNDQLHLGSCTKAMTATLVAQLIEEKKLKWSTRLVDVFPNLESDIHPDYRQITILDLVTHQAGLPKNNVNGWPKGRKLIRTLRFDLIKNSLEPKPENKVGDFFYSNLGFITAGAMLEKITNKKWEDLIKSRLFKKLDMNSAGFGPPGLRVFTGNGKSVAKSRKIDQPWGHYQDKEGNWVANRYDNPPILGPAGTVHCSIKDWAKFVSLHVSWKNRNPELLDKASLEFLQTPSSEKGNSCGWFSVERSWGRGRVISHNGSNTYWMANVWGSPNKDFAVMTVTNCCNKDSSKHLDEVASRMIFNYANHR